MAVPLYWWPVEANRSYPAKSLAGICLPFKFSQELPQVAHFTVGWLAMVVRKHLSVVSQNEPLCCPFYVSISSHLWFQSWAEAAEDQLISLSPSTA